MKASLSPSSFVSAAIVALCAGVSSFQALAETFYAAGVTADSGWLDINKAYNPTIFYKNNNSSVVPDMEAVAKYFPNEDSNLCWAASASNILQYMQIQAGLPVSYSSTYSTKTGNSTVDGLIHSVSQFAVYETFTSSFTNNGYTAYDGIAWYTTGTAAYRYSDSSTPANPGANGGFYASTLGNTTTDFQNKVLATHYQVYGANYAGNYVANEILNKSTSYRELFSESLANDPVALGVNKKGGNGEWVGGHAITCWGFETDDSGAVVSLFVTDSDDGLETLKTLTASQTDDGVLALSGGQTTSYVYDKDGKRLGSTSQNYEGFYLTQLSSFHNFYLSIPEPSGSALVLTGVLILLTRRRNKRA